MLAILEMKRIPAVNINPKNPTYNIGMFSIQTPIAHTTINATARHNKPRKIQNDLPFGGLTSYFFGNCSIYYYNMFITDK